MNEALYKLMLQAYPKEFQLEFGEELLQVFKLQLEDAKLEKKTLVFWVSVLLDCVYGATRERFLRKGEPMNWFLKLSGCSSLMIACCVFADATFRVFHSPGFGTVSFSRMIYAPVGVLVLPVVIGIVLSLPQQKNRWEWFGIGTILVYVLALLFFPSFGEQNPEIVSWFSFVLLAGFLALCFARVRVHSKGLDWSDMPNVSKSLIVMFLFFVLAINASSIFAPVFTALHDLRGLTNKDIIYNRGDIISSIFTGFAFVALAFGIWRSNQPSPRSPNLSV